MTGRSFAARLLNWWDGHGRKDLPWQHPRSPYRVWVSEIMLQQTQVSTVIPYFERFMERFPNLHSLAGAELDEVLAHWSGLGYYARARNLHTTALRCVREHGGELPETAVDLAALPGIGESTANAIVSQAHDRPATVLDGNVRRVMARHEAQPGWPGSSAVHKALWSAAERRLPKTRGADYTQAVMDLGATVCTRTQPSCNTCPVNGDCAAFLAGSVDTFPQARPRAPVREQTLYMVLARQRNGSVLLERRPPVGIWGGLWSLPDGSSLEDVLDRIGLEPDGVATLEPLEHRLTHILLNIKPCLAGPDCRPEGVKCDDGLRWFAPGQWNELGLPKPVLTLLRQLTDDGESA